MTPSLDQIRARVDQDLVAYLEEERAAVAARVPRAEVLVDELLRLVRAGGKRLRPAFCYWGYRAAGPRPHLPLGRVAVALELLHTASLIHDDIMDGAAMRRGGPATHVRLARDGGGRFGTSAAILAGDMALALALKLLAEARLPPRYLQVFRRWLTRHLVDMVAGQYLDVSAAGEPDDDGEAALVIASLKSGNYSVEMPVVLGALLARGGAPLLAALSAYGRRLGLAFQLQDDLLSVFGDPARTGKDRDQDLREGKRTYLLVRALAAAAPREREFLERHVGREDLGRAEAERVRDILRASGAPARTRELIERLIGEAKAALAPATMPDEARDALSELADLVQTRAS